VECGGPDRGVCNRQTGDCQCLPGHFGGACAKRPGNPNYLAAPGQIRGGNVGPVVGAGNLRCPLCPYRKVECGGPDRGVCNKQTGDCQCLPGHFGGACAKRPGNPNYLAAPGQIRAAGQRYAPRLESDNTNTLSQSSSPSTAMPGWSIALIVLAVVVFIALVVVSVQLMMMLRRE